MKGLLAPSKRLYLLATGEGKRKLIQLPFKLVDNFAVQDDSLVVVVHKTLTTYSQSSAEHEANIVAGAFRLASTFQTTLSKKIEAVIFQPKGLYLSDKYGDVFSVQKGQRTFLNENFAIPSFIHWVKGTHREYLIIADEYCKLKVFNVENPHELLAVWVPFHSQPVQMLTVGKHLLYLVRRVAKENTNSVFELYWLDSARLEEEDFPGKQLPYESEMSADNMECKIVGTTEQSFAVVCLQPEKIAIDHYKIGNEGVKQHKRQVNTIARGEWDSLSVLYLEKEQELVILYGQENELESPAEVQIESDRQTLTPKDLVFRVSVS